MPELTVDFHPGILEWADNGKELTWFPQEVASWQTGSRLLREESQIQN
jgi:hypothetical protein